MGDRGDGSDYDPRVVDRDNITLTRSRDLADALLTGPLDYAESEQEMWLDAGKFVARLSDAGMNPTAVLATAYLSQTTPANPDTSDRSPTAFRVEISDASLLITHVDESDDEN